MNPKWDCEADPTYFIAPIPGSPSRPATPRWQRHTSTLSGFLSFGFPAFTLGHGHFASAPARHETFRDLASWEVKAEANEEGRSEEVEKDEDLDEEEE
ncbi:hypothetical protein E2C01_064996 [Portunus trituberculatus]|uniref:Uncharacterized protein n=1 Tax=Portunus trituberculatus TaxID=210409 RepID=A0A5B7HEI4_PORTR|nr:hypothetical protein [Portunus trituberculatus]